MKKEQFSIGDKVFAKIKGYPPWPAIIVEENGKKYKVRFYGTGEIGQIKSEDLFYYARNKARLLKPSKRKDFNDSVKEIEEAIEEAGTDGDPNYGIEKNDSFFNDSSSVVDSEASFSKKRKRSVAQSVEDVPTTKAKRGRVSRRQSVVTPVNRTETDEVDTKSDEVIEETVSKPPEEEKIPETEVEREEEKPVETADTEVLNEVVYEETPQPESVEKPETQHFVFQRELEAYIAYADYVEKHKETYLKLPVEERDSSINQVLPFIFDDKCIGVKLHEEWCLDGFTNEYSRALYDKQISKRAIELKSSFKLEKLQESPKTYCEDLEKDQQFLDQFWENKLQKVKENILEKLKVESKLLDIDSKIKSCLNLDKADPEEAISLLDDMLDLDISPVMLKKHAHVVDMVRRLKKYVGNLESWNLTEEEVNKFKRDAEKVRGSALKLHVKFMKVIGKPSSTQSFWDHFNNTATKFREDSKDLADMEFYLLTSWPYSRENFLNNYFIKDISFVLPSQIDTIESKNA